jgi:hypothetical protein
MKPFVRLRDGELSDAERLLLDSASDDVPSFGAREKTLAALGVAAGAALAAPGVAHAAAQGAAGTGGAAASAVKAGSVTSVLVLKWLGTGALVGAVAATSVATLTTPGLLGGREAPPAAQATQAATPGSRAVSRAQALPHAAAAPPVASPEEAAPLRPVDEIPSAGRALVEARPERGASVAPPAEPVAAPPPPAPAAALTGNVMAEVASLDRARAALAARDASGALARLAAHEAAFPRGALLPEAILLRVRALRELGRYAEASAVAERFLASHPDSAQAARLRALVGTVR